MLLSALFWLGLSSPAGSSPLNGIPICRPDERPFAGPRTAVDYYDYEGLALGRVSRIHNGRSQVSDFGGGGQGTYDVEVLIRIKGRGWLPRGTFTWAYTDDGQDYNGAPGIGDIVLYVKWRGLHRGVWLAADEIHCIPVPPAG